MLLTIGGTTTVGQFSSLGTLKISDANRLMLINPSKVDWTLQREQRRGW